MKRKVSPGTIQRAEACCCDHACLSSAGSSICRAQGQKYGSTVLIECLDERDCPYKRRYLTLTICTCPVREELYDKHGV